MDEIERSSNCSALSIACEGSAAMMLVSGYAGVGKTSLIQELYKPIVRQRGYFIAGKFDQIARSTPFGALIQAFRGFIHQLLTKAKIVWPRDVPNSLKLWTSMEA